MFGLDDTGYGLNPGNMDFHQSVALLHPNLVLKFPHLKDIDDVDPLDISEIERGK